MNALRDLTDEVFGRLRVLTRSLTNTTSGKPRWVCLCSCGTECTVASASLLSGDTTSCGCYRKDKATRHGGARRGKISPEYRSWSAMVQRCTNENNIGYKNYGGRGITICARWLSFKNFMEDMGKKPAGWTLDRKNNDGPYCKKNCRWATRKQQAQNRRRKNGAGCRGLRG